MKFVTKQSIELRRIKKKKTRQCIILDRIKENEKMKKKNQ